MNEEPVKSTRLQNLMLACVAVAASWQVATRGLGASLAETWPEVAIYFNSADSVALASLANSGLLNDRKTVKGKESDLREGLAIRAEQVRTWAERAVRNDPLNARALYVLGQLALDKGDEVQASALMAAAARRSKREIRAVSWLLADSFKRKDFSSAAHHADVLLHVNSGLAAEITPALAWMAEQKAGNGEIKRLLAENPRWRSNFFYYLNRSITDARTPLDLLASLKDGSAPATQAELQAYLNFLIQKRLYDLAYYVWLQFLPPERLEGAGLLFNAGFERDPTGLPFDWTISPGTGVIVEIVPHPEQMGKRALFIEFGYGRVDFRPITQLVMLDPGPHRFKGEYRGEIIGRRGLEWRVTCAGGKSAVIGQSPMAIGIASNWTPFEFSFTVPGEDCRAQYVSLALAARSASEQLVSGSVWYGALEVTSGNGDSEAER